MFKRFGILLLPVALAVMGISIAVARPTSPGGDDLLPPMAGTPTNPIIQAPVVGPVASGVERVFEPAAAPSQATAMTGGVSGELQRVFEPPAAASQAIAMTGGAAAEVQRVVEAPPPLSQLVPMTGGTALDIQRVIEPPPVPSQFIPFTFAPADPGTLPNPQAPQPTTTPNQQPTAVPTTVATPTATATPLPSNLADLCKSLVRPPGLVCP